MQCDPDPLLVENMALKKEVEELQKEVIRHKWSFQKISDDDSKTRFYTGLPSFAVFMWLFRYADFIITFLFDFFGITV